MLEMELAGERSEQPQAATELNPFPLPGKGLLLRPYTSAIPLLQHRDQHDYVYYLRPVKAINQI